MLPLLLAIAQAASAKPVKLPTPTDIVAAAPAREWVAIAPDDLLIMDLAPDVKGRSRRVVIQLMPPPFSRGWVANIRTLARAHWWDGMSVNRVQDNYVAQWGDPNSDDKAKAKPLPAGLRKTSESEYGWTPDQAAFLSAGVAGDPLGPDPYTPRGLALMRNGWPVASDLDHVWPIHCYAMVGVGRDLSPDAGTGAELYTVIGQAPRQLDRNIALVGRVIEGIEHLSSLPRGTGALGFYEHSDERVPITRVRLASDLPAAERPRFEYLSTEGPSFARYVELRANRHDAFYIRPAGGVDVCNVPVPVRRSP